MGFILGETGNQISRKLRTSIGTLISTISDELYPCCCTCAFYDVSYRSAGSCHEHHKDNS